MVSLAHKPVQRLQDRKGCKEAGECLANDKRGEKKDMKKKIKRHKKEMVACGDMTGLKLRVRCHSEAPGCLIFYHVIPAL